MTNLTLERNYKYEEAGYKTYEEAIIVDGQKVGSAFVVIPPEDENNDEVYVENLDVEEAYRNQGIGTQTLLTLKAKYRDLYIAPTNEDNQRLYERLGEEVFGDWYDGVDQGYGVYYIG